MRIPQTSNDIRYKVLFLPSWYPSRLHPIAGIFIKKHAKAVALYCDVAVLYIVSDSTLKNKIFDVDITLEENNILTVRIYYKKVNLKVPLFSKFINFAMYIIGAYKGLRIIKEKFGRPDITHHVNVAYPSGIIALILKYLKGIPYVITEHWSGYTQYNGSYGNFKKLHKICCKKNI
jgi:hypothetical protein